MKLWPWGKRNDEPKKICRVKNCSPTAESFLLRLWKFFPKVTQWKSEGEEEGSEPLLWGKSDLWDAFWPVSMFLVKEELPMQWESWLLLWKSKARVWVKFEGLGF